MLADEFMPVFNRIDRHLRHLYRRSCSGKYPGYGLAIEALAAKDPVIATTQDDLRECGRLRNLIEHYQFEVHRPFAEPTEFALATVRTLEASLLNPELVIPRFKQKVEVADFRESLDRAMARMKGLDYSQLPVFAGERFCGLLTERIIARWVLSGFGAGQVMNTAAIPVGEVLACEANDDNVAFRPISTTVLEAVSLFQRCPRTGGLFLEALLLTETGAESADLKGIITLWDVAAIQTQGHPGLLPPT